MGDMLPVPDGPLIEEDLLEDEDAVAPDAEQAEDPLDGDLDGDLEEEMMEEPSPWLLARETGREQRQWRPAAYKGRWV